MVASLRERIVGAASSRELLLFPGPTKELAPRSASTRFYKDCARASWRMRSTRPML